MNLATSKIISMVTLGVGSFVAGVLPVCLSSFSKRRFPLLVSCLLCSGGGVLLATSLLHMLPEARESLPNYAEVTFCCGFLFIYAVDELVHFFGGDRVDNSDDRESSSSTSWLMGPHHSHSHDRQSRSYGATDSTSCEDEHHTREPDPCHVNHDEPCMRSKAGFVGLMVALLLHSVLEGLAIGLETVSTKVLLLLAAVSSHKFVVGFCLGIELSASTRGKLWPHTAAILVFSLGSVAGIGGGMALESTAQLNSAALGALQTAAAGTLLYVTVSEILPRERAKWHHGAHHAGLVQLSAVLIGFTLMYTLTTYCGH